MEKAFGKRLVIFIFVLAVFARVALIYDFFSFEADMSIQALAAKNLADGHGLTIARVHAADLSKVVYEPEVGWPPGYSLVVAAIYKFSHFSIPTACLVACMAGGLFFMIIFINLLKQLQLPEPVKLILVLYAGFSIPDHVVDSFPTDMTAMAFCLGACLITMKIFDRKGSGQLAILLGLATAGAAWFRYMYVPVSFVPAFFIIWNGMAQKNRELVRSGIYSLAANIVLIGLLLGFQYYYTGQAAYVATSGKGFFPGHLLSIYPFSLSSFFNLSFYALQLKALFHRPYEDWMKLFMILGMISTSWLLLILGRYLFRNRAIAASREPAFFILSGLISLGILAMLCVLSVSISKPQGPPFYGTWTFVVDRRYYAFIEIVILIAAAWRLFGENGRKNILLKLLFFCVIGAEIAHGGYVIVKFATGHPSIQTDTLKLPVTIKPVRDIINESHKKGFRVVFASTMNTFLGDAWIDGADCLYNYDEVNGKISASKPTLLIVVDRGRALKCFEKFITRKDVTRTMLINKYYFYSCYIRPHEGR